MNVVLLVKGNTETSVFEDAVEEMLKDGWEKVVDEVEVETNPKPNKRTSAKKDTDEKVEE